jgi:hypothetical protein
MVFTAVILVLAKVAKLVLRSAQLPVKLAAVAALNWGSGASELPPQALMAKTVLNAQTAGMGHRC